MDTKHKQAFFEERNHNIEDLQAGKNESINFPPHLHTDLELFFVESGCIEVGVGEERRSLTAGCFAVIFPNTIHFYSTKEEHSRFILVISRASLLGEYASKLPPRAISPRVIWAKRAFRCWIAVWPAARCGSRTSGNRCPAPEPTTPPSCSAVGRLVPFSTPLSFIWIFLMQ